MIANTRKNIMLRTLRVRESVLSFDGGRITIQAVERSGQQVKLRIEVDESVRVDKPETTAAERVL